MSNGPIPYGIKAPFDPGASFREGLQRYELEKSNKEARALEMAQMIEMADSSSMFGSDYSIASQWAEYLTENIDKFASSTEGLIKFQQQTKQLSSFIDGAESYKTENFGSIKDGEKAGTFVSYTYRKALGTNVYGDFIDERPDQSYEMAYMGLNQPVQLAWDNDNNMSFISDGRQVPFMNYTRPDAPFMPQLKEGKILMGSTWYADEGPNKSHETAAEAYDYSYAMTETDPKLARHAARFYQANEKPNMGVDAIMANEALMNEARAMWAEDARNSWINLRQKEAKDPTDRDRRLAQNTEALFQSEFVAEPAGPPQEGETNMGYDLGFSPTAIEGSIDLSRVVSANLKKKVVRNPEWVDEYSEVPKNIIVETPVTATPKQMALLPDGRIKLMALGKAPSGEEIPDVIVDPNTNEGRAILSQIEALFRESYPFTFEEYVNNYRQRAGMAEVAFDLDFNPNDY